MALMEIGLLLTPVVVGAIRLSRNLFNTLGAKRHEEGVVGDEEVVNVKLLSIVTSVFAQLHM